MIVSSFVVLGFVLGNFISAEFPIVDLKPECPSIVSGSPELLLTADVPAYALAMCVNGEKPFQTMNKAIHTLQGTFDPKHQGDHCVFQYTKANNSFTVNVEVGWGETDQSDSMSRMHVISCSYDLHGKVKGSTQTVSDWFQPPRKHQRLLGDSHVTANIKLKIVDENNKDVTWTAIPVGKKIRLMAYDLPDDTNIGFRPLSCVAANSENRYAILSQGCGDGFVLDNTVGFQTIGPKVYSPYFDAFRLRGDGSVHFVCNFSVCPDTCDGDSCLVQTRIRRAVPDTTGKPIYQRSDKVIIIKSDPIHTKVHEVQPVPTRKPPSPSPVNWDASDFLMHLGSLNRDYPQHPDPEVWMKVKNDQIRMKLFFTLTTFGILLFFTFLFTLYLCWKYEIVGTRTIA